MNSTPGTTTRGARGRRRAMLLGTVAGGSALLLTLATGPAQAAGTVGTIDIGHVDGLHVALNAAPSSSS